MTSSINPQRGIFWALAVALISDYIKIMELATSSRTSIFLRARIQGLSTEDAVRQHRMARLIAAGTPLFVGTFFGIMLSGITG